MASRDAFTGQAEKPAPWSIDAESLIRLERVDRLRGLEPGDVASRRAIFGPNAFREAARRRALAILVEQFSDVVVILLVAVGILAFALTDVAEGLAIFAVVLINGAIGFLTEWRATRSMEALRRLARIDCVVLREGVATRRPAEELVPGDIVLLDAGDLVPADLRVIEAAKLAADESTLTGESMPVGKHARPLPEYTAMFDRHNMLFKGTVVSRGTGRGIVTGTGLQTEFGRIFQQVSTAEPHLTPLERRLNRLGGRLARGVAILAVALAVAGILAGRGTLLAVEVAVALAVAAIPEGLPIVATVALARGMWRMARRNALVTRLSAVETLGATSVILTDKTGTLTENTMAVTTVVTGAGTMTVMGAELPGTARIMHDGRPPAGASARLLDEALTIAALCNNAELARGSVAAVGDPTEAALLVAASGRNIWRDELLAGLSEAREDPFDPDRKRMATLHRDGSRYRIAVKGAPEAILPLCTGVATPAGTEALDDEARQRWLDQVAESGALGLRTIAIASGFAASASVDPYADLVLHAVIGLEDPPRDGIAATLRQCRSAGIDVVMVTGDHAATALHIATVIGLLDGSEPVTRSLDGVRMERLLAEGSSEEVLAAKVFSRVTPDQKLALIDLYQKHGHVVAMTGDGVNDAPALKKADIGVAMGVRGTAVAREAASMVLQDDNLATVIVAVAAGRAIFENIRKFVVYLLSCNISEVLVVGLATVVGAPLPLLPLQILFLNLVTDVFPALALGVGPGSTSLMRRAPRPAAEQILTPEHWLRIGLHGGVMAATVLAAMAGSVLWLGFDHGRAVTVAFCTLSLAQMWHVFNMRDNMWQIVRNEIVGNIWVWAALILCALLVLASIYVPALATVLQLEDPGTRGWLLVLLASIVPLLTGPAIRVFARRMCKVPVGEADGQAHSQ